MRGRALRRAIATADVVRLAGPEVLPLIKDSTELITPDVAREMLQRNDNNRPINWTKVEEYAAEMRAGTWKLHAQGIVLDTDNNILTGQKRLWAVLYSGASVYMRVSRGNPRETARLLDRGTPQSARDLATRETGRKHSPIEVSIARAAYAADGIKPTTDELAAKLEGAAPKLHALLQACSRIKKTREIIMILAAALSIPDFRIALRVVGQAEGLADKLARALTPTTAKEVWGKLAAMGMAMQHAIRIVTEAAKALDAEPEVGVS